MINTSPVQGAVKRTFDFVFATTGLAVTAPVAALIALAIKLSDGGPVLFSQVRVGRKGQPFTILKFRTMRVDAESRGPSITIAGDARVTRVGRLLRKTKLDELPQLWNVVRGEMSFVGPRPEVPRYVALYRPEQREVLDLKPGITDEASLEFRDEEELLARAENPETYYIQQCVPRKIAINLLYARRANVFRDIQVILRTMRLLWLGD